MIIAALLGLRPNMEKNYTIVNINSIQNSYNPLWKKEKIHVAPPDSI